MIDTQTPAARINEKIASLGDCRGAVLARIRALIREADPAILEQVKWPRSGVPK